MKLKSNPLNLEKNKIGQIRKWVQKNLNFKEKKKQNEKIQNQLSSL